MSQTHRLPCSHTAHLLFFVDKIKSFLPNEQGRSPLPDPSAMLEISFSNESNPDIIYKPGCSKGSEQGTVFTSFWTLGPFCEANIVATETDRPLQKPTEQELMGGWAHVHILPESLAQVLINTSINHIIT